MRAATVGLTLLSAIALTACGGATKTIVERTIVTQAPAPPAVTTTTTTTTPAPPPAHRQRCGSVNVHLGHEAEGGSTSITATGVDCETAKRVVGACIQGRIESGWAIVSQNQGARFVATMDANRIVFNIVGGGGCTPV